MDVTTIILIIGGILLLAMLIWAVVAIVGLVIFRKAAREMDQEFNARGSRFNHFNRF
jgi:hypothetical protein